MSGNQMCQQRARVNLAEPRLYKVREAARLLDMSVTWVRRQVKAGRLQGYLCGDLLIPGRSINSFLAERSVNSVTAETTDGNTPVAR